METNDLKEDKMNITTFQYLWVRIIGILTIIIGIVHTVGTPMIYQRWAQILPQDKDRLLGVVFFFALAGFTVIFTGMLMIYSSFGLKKTEIWAKFIGLSASLFVSLLGIGAIIVGMSNPLIWFIIFGGISNIILLLISRTVQ